MTRRLTGRILVVVSVLAGAAVMVYVMSRAGADLSTVAGLLPVRIHVLAFAAFAVDFLFRAVRVVILARGVGHPVRFSTSLISMFAAEGAGAVTPSKAGAAPAKVAVLNRDDMDVGTASAVLAGEVVTEAAALLPLALATAILLPAGRIGALAAVAYAVIVTGAVLLLFVVARLPLRAAPTWWLRLRLSERSWRILRVVARRYRHRTKSLLHLSGRASVAVLVVTLVHIAGRMAILPALALGHVEGAGMAALVGWPFVLLYGGALIPTPGGGGAVEAAFAATLGGILDPSYLAGLMVWWRFYTFYLPAILGGALLLLGGFLMKRSADAAPATRPARWRAARGRERFSGTPGPPLGSPPPAGSADPP